MLIKPEVKFLLCAMVHSWIFAPLISARKLIIVRTSLCLQALQSYTELQLKPVTVKMYEKVRREEKMFSFHYDLLVQGPVSFLFLHPHTGPCPLGHDVDKPISPLITCLKVMLLSLMKMLKVLPFSILLRMLQLHQVPLQSGRHTMLCPQYK